MKKHIHKLYHPIIYRKPEPGHIINEMPLEQGLALLKEEEDYYPGEQQYTALMCTRLRKIYYDSPECSTYLIREARGVGARYLLGTKPSAFPLAPLAPSLLGYKYDERFNMQRTGQTGTYRADDRQHPERAGQIPEICEANKRRFILPEGCYCDIGHLLLGLDACNHCAPVCPLPEGLMWMRCFFPSVDSNADYATWLGNMAHAASSFLMGSLQKQTINPLREPEDTETKVPLSDLLGYIDSYVIHQNYPTSAIHGKRLTEILCKYYSDGRRSRELRAHRCSIFCRNIGLKEWEGSRFAQEEKWISRYKKQLRNATAFYILGQLGTKKGAWIALKIWFRCYEKELDLELLLHTLLDVLKAEIKKEYSSKKERYNQQNLFA